jgi:hypothetical protein
MDMILALKNTTFEANLQILSYLSLKDEGSFECDG